MVIETRFERDQEVWFRRNGNLMYGRVYGIDVYVRPEGISIRYNVQYSESEGELLYEKDVFGSKEEACGIA